MKFLFFFLGVPMMIMSFFEAVDVLPYVQSAELLVNGHEIVLTEDEQSNLQQQISDLFENSRTMPAFGVMFDEQFHEIVKDGTFVSLKFGRVLEVNDLPFDELVFEVNPEYYGFNLFRGMNGVFQGRCIYIDLNGKNMQEFSDYIYSLSQVQENLNNETELPIEEEIEEKFDENLNEETEEKETTNELPVDDENADDENSQIDQPTDNNQNEVENN